VLGRDRLQAVRGRRDEVVIATKFGYRLDESARAVVSYADGDVASRLRADLDASLGRLGTDYIDIYLLHVWELDVQRALDAREVLETLVTEGKIRTYGWSTDRTDAVGSTRPTARSRPTTSGMSPVGTRDSATAARRRTGWTSLPRSVRFSPAVAEPWHKAHWPGSGPAAPTRCRSQGSGPWPRSRRTAERSPSDR
jgi:hypothetical protein